MFKVAKEAGYQGIELCIDYLPFFDFLNKNQDIAAIAASVGAPTEKNKSLTFDSTRKEYEELKKIAFDHHLEIASMHTQAQMCWTLMEPDDKKWKIGINLIRRLIDFAVIMECKTLLILPGFVTPRISYDYGLKRLEESLWILKEDAEEKKVRLGIENIWSKILYSPLEMRDFVDKFDSPYIGIHFDVGNVLQYGYPDQWIRILGKKRIFNIHLKDYSELINNMTGYTWLFQGDVPWDRVMDALYNVGYDGFLIAEVPPYPFYPEEGVRDTARKIDILINRNF